MKDKWKGFDAKTFTFEEFRDSIENECLHGEDPDKVAKASLDVYIKEGFVEVTEVANQFFYIRTDKKLPPQK
jgi:hypothetical protein